MHLPLHRERPTPAQQAKTYAGYLAFQLDGNVLLSAVDGRVERLSPVPLGYQRQQLRFELLPRDEPHLGLGPVPLEQYVEGAVRSVVDDAVLVLKRRKAPFKLYPVCVAHPILPLIKNDELIHGDPPQRTAVSAL